MWVVTASMWEIYAVMCADASSVWEVAAYMWAAAVVSLAMCPICGMLSPICGLFHYMHWPRTLYVGFCSPYVSYASSVWNVAVLVLAAQPLRVML